jgi:hypothetical protein
MGDLDLVEHATDQQTFIAPVKLEGFTELEVQWHKCLGHSFARALAPGTHEVRHRAVATLVALRLDLDQQRLRRASGMFGALGISFECLLQQKFDTISPEFRFFRPDPLMNSTTYRSFQAEFKNCL